MSESTAILNQPVELARGLATGFAGRAAESDRTGSFPVQDFAELRAAGLLGLMVPERLGGLGAGFAGYSEVAMELAAGNGATALVFNMHASVTGALALTSDDVARALGVPDSYFAMRDRVLSAAAGGALYGVAMSERGAGSRLSQLATTYEKVPEGWRIKGAKAFCSGAGHADAYLVAAKSGGDVRSDSGAEPARVRSDSGAEPARVRSDSGAEPASSVSQFVVPADTPGIVVEETWDALGMRATASHDLHLDVVVPEDALIGGIEGLGVLLAQVMPQWLVASYAAVYVGVAQAALDAAAAYATERNLGRLPAVRARLGRADAAVAAARQVVREAARRVDAAAGDPETNRWVWRAKLLAGQTAAEVAASMLEACGTAATRRGHPLERLYRDARCGSLQPATSDVCADWLGMAALGLDPENQAEVPRW